MGKEHPASEEKILELCRELSPAADSIELFKTVFTCPDSLIGQAVTHAWEDGGERKVFNGRVLKMKKKDRIQISYWNENETEDAAEDYDLGMKEILVDILCGDFVLKL